MTVYELITLLIIAGLSGFIASQLMGAKRVNLVMMIVLGFIGAWVGQYLAGLMNLPPLFVLNVAGKAFPLVWSVIGSTIVVGIAASIGQQN